MKTAIGRYAALFLLLAVALPLQVRGENVKVEGLIFQLPDGWKSVTPLTQMRKAQLEVTRGSEKAEVTFFHFGADQGGSPAENVARWFGQFPGSEDKRVTEHVTVGAIKVTFAMTEGTYESGMPGGPTTPMENYALCGAILETSAGNIFVKMTGPNGVMKASTEAFKKMISDAAKAAAPQA